MNGRNRSRGRGNRPSRQGKPAGQKQGRQAGLVGRLADWFKGLFKSREPQVPITTSRLYVGNLPYKAESKDLTELFAKCGEVKSAEIIYDRGSRRSKGFGFVEMDCVASAQKAADMYHNRTALGRKLIVSGAKAEGERLERRSDLRPRPEHQEEEATSESAQQA